MVQHLTKIEFFDFLNFKWTNDMGKFGTLLHKVGPVTVVLVINVTVIALIDYASVIERYDSHSQYQITVFLKTLLYTNLNMFIIPVLTLSGGGQSVFELFKSNNFNLAKILSELFIPKSGEFFVLLLV